jgi:hypothetical protein
MENKTKKQEEWRGTEEDIWYMVGGKLYLNYNGEEYIRTEDVEQLLSEKTFTKEELEWIRIKAKESNRAFTAGTRDALEEIENKAIKLLKEEE